MTTDSISLFQAMNAKMQYLAARQKVISQNISNANTPGVQGMDIEQPSFDKVLSKVTKQRALGVELTNPDHMNKGAKANMSLKAQRNPYEVAPDKNAINIEEQLVKANDIQMNYNMMLNLYSSNMEMMRTAIGKRS